VFSRNVGYQLPTSAAQLPRGVKASTAPEISRLARTSCLNYVSVTICMCLHWTLSYHDCVWRDSDTIFTTISSSCYPVFFQPSSFITTLIPSSGKQTVHLSGCQRRRRISNKQTQRLYILRVPSAFWFNNKQVLCVWIWPCTCSTNHNCWNSALSIKTLTQIKL